jgi:hypothetical protein
MPPAGSAPAHSAGTGHRGPSTGTAPVRGFRNHGVSPHHGNHRYGSGGFFYPYYPYDNGMYDTDTNGPEEAGQAPPREVPERGERPAVEVKPLPDAQVIEIPAAQKGAAVKPLPPTVFILTSGEKLEAQQYLLTASSLSVTVHRAKRTIPVEMLDFDATLAANRDRGIDLRIPGDRNEVSLRF